MQIRPLALLAALLPAAVPVPALCQSSVLAGVADVRLLDAGVMTIGGDAEFVRTEAFEYLQQADGRYTLLNTITAGDGRYRVRGRFDYDEQWQATSASGVGLYAGGAVDIAMRIEQQRVKIEVDGKNRRLRPAADCDPDCFLNLSPSAIAMFVMTRHYDMRKGGDQTFRWSGQDLDREYTLSGGTAELRWRGTRAYPHAGSAIMLRHFTFRESLPAPEGGRFVLDFDLWTDDEHRPIGFRVRIPGGSPEGTVGSRTGFEQILSRELVIADDEIWFAR